MSKLTGHQERLDAFDAAYQRIGSLDEIETVPPNALIRLGAFWPTGFLPQQYLEQWGQMEIVVVYNDNQKFTWEYSEDYVRDHVAASVVGSLGPEVTKKVATR